MLRLLKWAIVVGAVAGVVAFVPIGGRTLVERWRAARSPAEFVRRCMAELRAAWDGKPAPASPARPPRGKTRASGHARATRGTPPRPARAPSAPPTEQHTDAERLALDRVVAEHVRSPAP